MKRLLLTLALALALALPAGAAIEYVDYDNGNDSTGDGSYGNPWATIDKCTTTKTGGDECRVAKMDPTALSGTLTFTNGSTSVSTSVDLTGDVAAGDYVGLDATDESWWRVASITSDTITLDYQYWGPGTGVATAGYEAVYFALADAIDINSSGTSLTSRMMTSGGWDLTTQTQTGKTYLSNYGQTFYFGYANSKNYFEFSNFVCLADSSTFYGKFYQGDCYGQLLKDLIYVNCQFTIGSGRYDAPSRFENVIQSGGTGSGFYPYSAEEYGLYNCISYSSGNDSGDYGINTVTGANSAVFSDVSIYNTYSIGIYLYNMVNCFLEDIVIDTTRSNAGFLIYSDSKNIFGNNISISNTASYGIYVGSASTEIKLVNLTFDNIGSDEVSTNFSAELVTPVIMTISDYDGVSGDDRIYFGAASAADVPYIQRDTTDARSGSCLKFWPEDANDYLFYKIGTVKVTDGSSDLVLSAYAKDDATFNGNVAFYAEANSRRVVDPTAKTMTTSYVQQSITVPAAEIATDDYVHLWIGVMGTAGSVYVDDFSSTN